MSKEFMENDGGVHLMGPYHEFTVCGDALDSWVVKGDAAMFKPASKKVVTCERCIEFIEHCRNVKTNNQG